MKRHSILLLSVTLLAMPVSHAQNNAAASPAYHVVDGNKVDSKTLLGWRTWRALACDGAQQEGLVGPSLVDAFKTLEKNEFHRTVFGGRVQKGMPDFSSSKMMQDNWESLYAYLKGRSDGQIKPGDLHAVDSN
jgi:hypothetical protein